MYVPASFAVTEPAVLHEFMERHSFATLVSHDGTEPFASHVPLLLDRDTGPKCRLIGHVARANPQWKHAGGQRVLAIFSGPHAYVSPTWYAAQNVVPTWNYVAVHAYGVLRLIDARERLREIVRRTVAVYEANMPQPWSVDMPEAAFIDKLLESIVGFVIDVDRIRDALGRPRFTRDDASTEPTVGVVNGLAVTGAGGDVLLVEATAMDATRRERGELTLTGQLGDVMSESGAIALSYIRSRRDAR